jgi:PAS domain S-box-containing protein
MADGRLRVLLLEDNPADAELVARELRRGGLEPDLRLASGKREFIKALKSAPPDLILADYNVPGFSGLDALALARAAAPQAPFLFVSGSIREELAIESLSQGAADYIFKNNLQRLVPAVRRVLAAAELQRRTQLAEKMLRDSEKKYRSLVSQSPDGIFIVDLNGRFLSVNPAICASLGYREDELLGRSIWDVIPAAYRPLHEQRLAGILRGEEQHEAAEYLVKGRNGEEHAVAILSAPFYRDDALIGFQGIARDITEKKKMEDRLRESEEYYRTLVDTSPDAIVIVDAGGRITYASQRACGLFAVPTGDDIRGTSVLDFVQPEEARAVEERLAAILSGLALPEIREYRLLRRDRRPFWGEVASSPLQDAKGRRTGLLLVCRDVSQRKDTELKLQQALAEAQRLRQALDQVPVHVYMKDLQSRYVYANQLTLKLFGCSAQELAGKSDEDFFPPEAVRQLREVDRRVFAGESTVEEIAVPDPRKGETLYHEVKTPIYAGPESREITGLLGISTDITERKRHLEALRESERKYRLIADNTAETITALDMGLRFTYVSPSIFRLRGFTVEEAMSQSIEQALTPDSVELVKQILEEEMRREADGDANPHRSRTLELQEQHKDGRVIWVENSLSILRDDQGAPIGFLAVAKDVTERKRAEEQIRYQADMLQRVNDAIIATDGEGNIRVWNEAAERIYGWTAGEVLGRNFRGLVAPEYRAQSREEVAGMLDRDGAWSGELSHRLRDGRRIPVHSTITILKDSSGAEKGRVSINHDISERLRAETALRRSENLLSKIFDILPVGLWLADGQGRLVRSNRAGREIWGAEPLVGTPDYGVFKARRLPEGKEIAPEDWALAHSIREKVTVTDEMLEIDAFDGRKKTILNYTAPVLDEQGRVEAAIVVNLDISARRQAEEKIRASLREKEVLLQEIHHRVKNNLQIVSGLLTLQAGFVSSQPLDEIFRASQDRIRSIALVHEKLYRSHNLAEIAFDGYLRTLTQELLTSHGIESDRVRVRFETEPILLTIDKAIPLGLIVNELLTNAVKHAFPAGKSGSIRIGLQGRRQFRFAGVKTESGTLYRFSSCELTVEDDGIGLPSPDAAVPAKTLGMQLVTMLASQLHAELKVEPGPGARFILCFPGQPPDGFAGEPAPQGETPWPNPAS